MLILSALISRLPGLVKSMIADAAAPSASIDWLFVEPASINYYECFTVLDVAIPAAVFTPRFD